MAEPKKPVKVIKAGDMSPETKTLPDEVVKPPKGIGSSEKDMSPLPKKDTSAPTKKAATKPDYEGEMGYSPEEMAEVEQARKRLAKQGIYKKGGKITEANYDKEYGKIYRKAVKNMSKGGSTASKRADGCAIRGKTRA